MFSGDIVESLNYILKDHFLCSSGRGGGPCGRVARDKRMLRKRTMGTVGTYECGWRMIKL